MSNFESESECVVIIFVFAWIAGDGNWLKFRADVHLWRPACQHGVISNHRNTIKNKISVLLDREIDIHDDL